MHNSEKPFALIDCSHHTFFFLCRGHKCCAEKKWEFYYAQTRAHYILAKIAWPGHNMLCREKMAILLCPNAGTLLKFHTCEPSETSIAGSDSQSLHRNFIPGLSANVLRRLRLAIRSIFIFHPHVAIGKRLLSRLRRSTKGSWKGQILFHFCVFLLVLLTQATRVGL